MKKKKILIVLLILLILITGGCYAIWKNSLKEINKSEIKVMDYIDYTDEISANKVQVNWKYVAAILGVMENNRLDDISSSQIKKVANMFINEDKNNYKLNSLDTVMDKLELSESKKKRVYNYIDDLKYYGLTPNKIQPDTKYVEFINKVKPGAIENYKKYDILPSITIAQAILETGWGESKLASEFNNLFGIKADRYWKGEYVTLETTEYNGMVIDDKFRKYKDATGSIVDHGKFIYENKRYATNGVFEARTYKQQANILQEAGYSTAQDENGQKIYAKMLINLIQQYNLQLIDSEVQSSK